MFIKLVANSSVSNTSTGAFYQWTLAIKNFLDGTYTSTSDLSADWFNVSSCQVIGSYPQRDNGDDTCVNLNISTNTTSSSDNYLNFDFRHAESDSTYDYHRTIRLYYTATGTYGCRFRVYDGASNYGLPYNSTSYYTYSSSTNYLYSCDYPNETAYIWANKHSFVIQQFNGSYMTCLGVFGHDASAANEYQYDQIGSARHGPFVSMGSYMYTSRWNTGNYDNTTYDQFWVGTQSYLNPGQSTGTSTNLNTSYNLGYSDTTDSYYMSLTPQPWKNVYPLRTATGHVHQLIPVYADPHNCGDTSAYPFNGRLKSLYRTSDDIAAPGTTLTYDGTQYAVLMPYKCGGNPGGTINTQNMCYLIPTTVDGR